MIHNILDYIKDNAFAVITAVVAIIALFQTNKQLRTSNKQYLFDRRLRNYSIISGLIKLYEENEWLLKEEHKEDEPIDVEFLFYGLINNSYLEELHTAIEHPLEQPYQKDFLKRLDEIEVIGKEIKFLYGKYDDVTKFVLNYKEILHSLYKYQNLQNEMIKSAQNFKKTYKQTQKNYKESNHRSKLLKSYSNLVDSYINMKKHKTISKMEKEIKL